MSVRAKFKVSTISPIESDGSISQITLYPVCSGSKENETFFKWTPSGEIRIGTINSNAAKQFELNKEYYVDFTPAEI
jgi:hypothetical protein